MNALRILLIAAVTALLLPSCRRDELFTEEPGIQLSFSEDTIFYDTIFTTVGSVTKRFTARNPSNNAVRVDISLLGGGPSPYRINVDGASGTSFQDVEILGGDSVFVFVEATLGPGGPNTPFVIEDHIVFNTNGTEQSVLLVAWGQNAHFFRPDRAIQGFPPFSIIAGGLDQNGNPICETVTWANDLPYVIYGYAVVDSCSRLNIEPGVRVYVHGGGGMWIYRYGQLVAEGTVEAPITFQSDRLEAQYAELPGQWDRIWINEGDAGVDNRLVNVVIKNALIGVQSETFPLYPETPTSENKLVLNNVKIRNCSAAGILSRNYRIQSTNLLVGDCGQYSVALTGGGQYFFNHTTIANYWDYEVRQTPAFILTNTTADITGALQVREIESSSFNNGIIYGSNELEFQTEINDLAPTAYTFNRYLFRSNENNTSDPDHFPFQDGIFRNQSPGFVSTSDRNFHLVQNAFAWNRGQSIASPDGANFEDLDGVDRGADGNYALGCYEYVP